MQKEPRKPSGVHAMPELQVPVLLFVAAQHGWLPPPHATQVHCAPNEDWQVVPDCVQRRLLPQHAPPSPPQVPQLPSVQAPARPLPQVAPAATQVGAAVPVCGPTQQPPFAQ